MLAYLLNKYWVNKKSFVTVTGKPTQARKLIEEPHIKWPLFAFCLIVSAIIILFYGTVIFASFVRTWGVDFSLTLDQYRKALQYGWDSLKNSMTLGLISAVIGGLLGMNVDDSRLRDSLRLAAEAKLEYSFYNADVRGAHPNTAVLRLTGASGRKLEVVGASIGGGRINICQIDGITTNFGGDHNTLIVHNQDTPGHVAAVTGCLSGHGVNIATMQLYRSTAGGYAVMVLECDEPIPDEIAGQLGSQPGIVKVTILNL